MNSLPKTVTRQRRDCDLNPGPTAPVSGTLNTRLPTTEPPQLLTVVFLKILPRIFGASDGVVPTEILRCAVYFIRESDSLCCSKVLIVFRCNACVFNGY